VQPHEDHTSTRADYVAMLERADRGVGRIVDTLQKRGLTRNTLVIFTNDNGGEWLSRNAPLFNRKQTIWEGGIRVPLMMKWPARIPSGRTTPQSGFIFDLTATILAAGEAAIPPDARLEGMNLLPVVTGQSQPVERTLFFRVTGNRTARAVRQGDWKLMVDGPNTMLFNVRTDMGERNDLAKDRLDIVRRLRPLIAAWEEDVDAEAKMSPNAPPAAEAAGRGGRGGRGAAAPQTAPK
jgi:arylsulfatase A-like enzyme